MNKIKPEIFFVFILLFFGILHLINTPLGAGFDEDTHIARIWEMSKGVLLPNQYLSQGPYFPQVFYQLSYRQQKTLTPISLTQWNDQLRAKIDWNNMIFHNTRATYFPLLYLPQAFMMGLFNRVLDLPVAFTYYLLRLSYLLTYALLVYLSIHIIPFGKWVLGILSIAPMAIVQASTVQPESINNGICFLFVAWVLYIVKDQKSYLSRRDIFITSLLVLSIGFIKVNSLPILLLVFLIPSIKFGGQTKKFIFLSIALLTVVAISVGWNFLLNTNMESMTLTNANKPSDQFMNIFSSPLLFLQSLFTNITSQASNYFTGWVGVSGYSYWRLPGFIYYIYPLLLFLAVVSEKSDNFLDIKKRSLLFSVFILMSFSTILVFYLTSFSNNSFSGVQGRYFTGSALLLFLSLIPKNNLIKIKKSVLQIPSILIQVIFIISFLLAYHVNCGSSFYSLGYCYQPLYKNWSPQTGLSKSLTNNSMIQQTFTSSCENLTQLRFWINQKSTDPQNKIQIRISNLKTNDLVVNQIIENLTNPSSGWLYMDFPPILGSKNIPYEIDINPEYPQSMEGNDFAFSKTDEYPDGELFFEGKRMDGDLLFQYGCLTGLAKMIK